MIPDFFFFLFFCFFLFFHVYLFFPFSTYENMKKNEFLFKTQKSFGNKDEILFEMKPNFFDSKKKKKIKMQENVVEGM
jgi:hypothetical protein